MYKIRFPLFLPKMSLSEGFHVGVEGVKGYSVLKRNGTGRNLIVNGRLRCLKDIKDIALAIKFQSLRNKKIRYARECDEGCEQHVGTTSLICIDIILDDNP